MLAAPSSALKSTRNRRRGRRLERKTKKMFPFPSGYVAGRKLFVTSYSRFRLEYVQGDSTKSEYRVMYRLNHNQEIIELLLKLREYEEEYPVRLLAARRLSFITLVSRYVHAFLVRI